MQNSICENIRNIKDRIRKACFRVGRNPEEVKLLMATKTVEPERIKEAIACGEYLIGENKVQEYVEKYEEMKEVICERHFIGHLQTNKVKDILKYVTCIQSLDRIDLAEKLQKRLIFEQKTIDALIEVNTSGEASKHGLNPAEVFHFLEHVQSFDRILVKGFMTIGLLSDDVERVRPCFTQLKNLQQEALAKQLVSKEATVLSMGMSGDLEIAIEEGSTMIRVGSAIFGNRVYV